MAEPQRFLIIDPATREVLRSVLVTAAEAVRMVRGWGVDLSRVKRYGVAHYLRHHAPRRHPKVKPNRRRVHRRRR